MLVRMFTAATVIASNVCKNHNTSNPEHHWPLFPKQRVTSIGSLRYLRVPRELFDMGPTIYNTWCESGPRVLYVLYIMYTKCVRCTSPAVVLCMLLLTSDFFVEDSREARTPGPGFIVNSDTWTTFALNSAL